MIPVPTLLQIPVGLLDNLCTLVADPTTAQCALVDPAFEVDRLLRTVAQHQLTLTTVLITHAHFDHIEGLPALLRALPHPLRVYVGRAEAPAVRTACQSVQPTPDLVLLDGGEILALGALRIDVLSTPGHTVSGTSYYLPAQAAVITGDTLFVGSCGRPASAHTVDTLWHSLQRLAALPEETRIYPGHDYGTRSTSTIGWELEQNPYLRASSAEEFHRILRSRISLRSP